MGESKYLSSELSAESTWNKAWSTRAEEAWDGRMAEEEGEHAKGTNSSSLTLCHRYNEDERRYSPLVPGAWFAWLLSTSVSRGYLSSLLPWKVLTPARVSEMGPEMPWQVSASNPRLYWISFVVVGIELRASLLLGKQAIISGLHSQT